MITIYKGLDLLYGASWPPSSTCATNEEYFGDNWPEEPSLARGKRQTAWPLRNAALMYVVCTTPVVEGVSLYDYDSKTRSNKRVEFNHATLHL